MHYHAKQAALFLPAILIGLLVLQACETDLKKIKEVSAKQVSQPIELTTGVEIIYSDSAIVKAKMTTPLLVEHSIAKSFDVMPKGVKVDFYDKDQKETSNIVADSGVYRKSENLIEFYKNVVATNTIGETYKSDELIWDMDKKILYSNKPVKITMSNGDVTNGVNFKSDDKLSNPSMDHGTGVFNVTEDPTQ